MALFFLYPRGECCDPNPEHRQDTLELLRRRRSPVGGNVVDEPHKNACPDQIAHLDPVVRNHLCVGPTKRKSEPP